MIIRVVPEIALPIAELLPLAELLPRAIGPYMTLMVIGFLVGIAGHIIKARLMIIAGIMMIFMATVLFPLAINLTQETPREVSDLARDSR
ncbi:MAG TPA: hypothetical protein VFD37_00670 [Solirubrobacterales bacterium]|nr:hypothetical protein [Solirubrobacterales bacterium]